MATSSSRAIVLMALPLLMDVGPYPQPQALVTAPCRNPRQLLAASNGYFLVCFDLCSQALLNHVASALLLMPNKSPHLIKLLQTPKTSESLL